MKRLVGPPNISLALKFLIKPYAYKSFSEANSLSNHHKSAMDYCTYFDPNDVIIKIEFSIPLKFTPMKIYLVSENSLMSVED